MSPDEPVELPSGATFEASVVPDAFDARDLDYRPRLQPLLRELECRPEDRWVTTQAGSSCTGHAVAAMFNAVHATQVRQEQAAAPGTARPVVHASPYMLYAMARRYDEFEGEADAGSSLRGALKGWYYHGVLPEEDWPALDTSPEPDPDHDPAVAAAARRHPLGAFYRVDTARLDDLQSAIAELSVVVVSAAIHDGWNHPERITRTVDGTERTMHLINRTDSSQGLGGHAFCLVGYNEVGFLVQNSWGTEWGGGGFATLPYDDWLESGYDAWVARPGVPSVVSERTRRRILAAGDGLVEAPGPDLQELASHVVNLGNDGRLSRTGRFTSTPVQLDRIFATMDQQHGRWSGSVRRVVLYAHGGLNSERTGLSVAQRQLNWWLRNEVYPVTFAWQSGLVETIENQVGDLIGPRQPAGGFSTSLLEQADRLVENIVRSRLQWLWSQMKENAEAASQPLSSGVPEAEQPGVSLVVERLRQYVERQREAGVSTELHLVGHSAGSIFLAGVLDRLVDVGVPVASLSYLAGALRTDTWLQRVLPHLEADRVGSFSAFGMSTRLELDDSLSAGPVTPYRKSLLYLVSRAFEEGASRTHEVPLVGMQHFVGASVNGRSFAEAVAAVGGELVWSPSGTPPRSRSESTSHGGFDDDTATMTSVMLRILDEDTVTPRRVYAPHLPPPTGSGDQTTAPGQVEDDQPPEVVPAEVHGDPPSPALVPAAAAAPPTTRSALRGGPGGGAGPSRVMQALTELGWTPTADESKEPSS